MACHCHAPSKLSCNPLPACRDQDLGKIYRPGQVWEKRHPNMEGAILDCACVFNDGVITKKCDSQNRCNVEGRSYKNGDQWLDKNLNGHFLECLCEPRSRGAWKCDVAGDQVAAEKLYQEQELEYERKTNVLVIAPNPVSTNKGCQYGLKTYIPGQSFLKYSESNTALCSCDFDFSTRCRIYRKLKI